MYYDVLINYCGLDSSKASWSRIPDIKTFNLVQKFNNVGIFDDRQLLSEVLVE